MSGGGEKEFISSKEPLELSGTVQVRQHVPLGLAGAIMDAFRFPSSRWQCCIAEPNLCCLFQ